MKRLNKKRDRDFSSIEARDHDTGKVLSVKGRRIRDEKDNRKIVEAMDRVRTVVEKKNIRPATSSKTFGYRKKETSNA